MEKPDDFDPRREYERLRRAINSFQRSWWLRERRKEHIRYQSSSSTSSDGGPTSGGEGGEPDGPGPRGQPFELVSDMRFGEPPLHPGIGGQIVKLHPASPSISSVAGGSYEYEISGSLDIDLGKSLVLNVEIKMGSSIEVIVTVNGTEALKVRLSKGFHSSKFIAPTSGACKVEASLVDSSSSSEFDIALIEAPNET